MPWIKFQTQTYNDVIFSDTHRNGKTVFPLTFLSYKFNVYVFYVITYLMWLASILGYWMDVKHG